MSAPPWLDPAELRIGLGCMRLSTGEPDAEQRAFDTIAAAAAGGITVFDTARAYGRDETDLGGNERLLAAALRAAGAAGRARIVTKGGMTRPGGGWVADGRARSIAADCEASLAALDGLPIDLYLLHAPDPRTPWATSVRALGRQVEAGLVPRVGLANVNRRQLDEAVELAPVAAVQVALSAPDDRALRGGVVERCGELGIALVAHSPLGGPRRAAPLARHPALVAVGAAHGATAAEAALAWLLGIDPCILAIPGARRPETARSAARAAALRLTTAERAAIARAFAWAPEAPAGPGRPQAREVVVVMGIPGAGKSRLAEAYAARGHVRLNRDERGGSLRELAHALGEQLAADGRAVVLDNTYLTRVARSYVVEVAAEHGVAARCVWLDTPLAQAQVNLVARLLQRFGRLPEPEELARAGRREPGLMAPTSQMRALRELEPPAADEGFAAVERVAFVREPGPDAAGVFVAAAALEAPGWEAAVAAADPAAPHLVFDWRPGGGDLSLAGARLAPHVSGPVEEAVCPHPGGPPRCWCRPPLPGLPLAFARRHGIDPARSAVIGTSPAHRTLAAGLGARHIEAGARVSARRGG